MLRIEFIIFSSQLLNSLLLPSNIIPLDGKPLRWVDVVSSTAAGGFLDPGNWRTL
ncbi:hypothetical protein [Hyella patelloides]|uniref:hypothetical protein n=1 Tax=Hyella patelloides TaxID=1982969 RepID=UPI0016439C63|nr:hypothetical protein [Hyella patelloides]